MACLWLSGAARLTSDAALEGEEEEDALDARDEVPGQPRLRLISESAVYSQSMVAGDVDAAEIEGDEPDALPHTPDAELDELADASEDDPFRGLLNTG